MPKMYVTPNRESERSRSSAKFELEFVTPTARHCFRMVSHSVTVSIDHESTTYSWSVKRVRGDVGIGIIACERAMNKTEYTLYSEDGAICRTLAVPLGCEPAVRATKAVFPRIRLDR